MRGIKYPVRCDGVSFIVDSVGESLIECDAWVSDQFLVRIAACLNACRDISTEDLEKFGGEEQAFRRNWMLRQAFQDLLFVSSNDMEGE